MFSPGDIAAGEQMGVSDQPPEEKPKPRPKSAAALWDDEDDDESLMPSVVDLQSMSQSAPPSLAGSRPSSRGSDKDSKDAPSTTLSMFSTTFATTASPMDAEDREAYTIRGSITEGGSFDSVMESGESISDMDENSSLAESRPPEEKECDLEDDRDGDQSLESLGGDSLGSKPRWNMMEVQFPALPPNESLTTLPGHPRGSSQIRTKSPTS